MQATSSRRTANCLQALVYPAAFTKHTCAANSATSASLLSIIMVAASATLSELYARSLQLATSSLHRQRDASLAVSTVGGEERQHAWSGVHSKLRAGHPQATHALGQDLTRHQLQTPSHAPPSLAQPPTLT